MDIMGVNGEQVAAAVIDCFHIVTSKIYIFPHFLSNLFLVYLTHPLVLVFLLQNVQYD